MRYKGIFSYQNLGFGDNDELMMEGPFIYLGFTETHLRENRKNFSCK